MVLLPLLFVLILNSPQNPSFEYLKPKHLYIRLNKLIVTTVKVVGDLLWQKKQMKTIK